MVQVAALVVASLALQSLGEVAERERERREANEEAGVEAASYTIVGGAIEREGEKPETVETPEGVELPRAEEEDASPLEEARQRGEFLEPRMVEIARAADGVDALYERYMRECYGRYAVGRTPPGIGIPTVPPPPAQVQAGRDWFVVLETPSALTTPVPTGRGGSFILVEPPQCESLRHRILDAAEAVRQAMRELLELARRERILPGVVRELREKYRLEWPGWER